MLKFIHAADLHLDSPLRGLAGSQEHAQSIREASRRACASLVQESISREVAFVVIAGDLWDVGWKDVRTGNFLIAQLRKLGEAEIEVFIVFGNHDLRSNWQDQFARMVPANVHIFGSKQAETVLRKYSGVQVALHGQSYSSRSVTANLARGYPPADAAADLNIGILHTSLAGHADGHEPYAPCSPDDLNALGYDYWALGHVHQRRLIADGSDGGPAIAYSGVIQGRHIREDGMKGAYAVSMSSGGKRKLAVEEIDLADVLFSRLQIDAGACATQEDAFDAFRRGLRELRDGAPADLACHVVRVQLANAPAQLAGSLRYQEDLRAEFAGLAMGEGGELLIERVEVETAAGRPAADSAQSMGLDKFLHAAAEDAAVHARLNEQLRAVLDKQPREVCDELAQEFGNPPDLAAIARLLGEANADLAGAMAGEGQG